MWNQLPYWHHPGIYSRIQKPRPTPDLMNQNLLLNKFSRWFVCTWKTKKSWLNSLVHNWAVIWNHLRSLKSTDISGSYSRDSVLISSWCSLDISLSSQLILTWSKYKNNLLYHKILLLLTSPDNTPSSTLKPYLLWPVSWWLTGVFTIWQSCELKVTKYCQNTEKLVVFF